MFQVMMGAPKHILIFALFITQTFSQSVFKINTSSGILFHPLGTAQVSNNKFSFISYTNLSYLENKLSIV